MTYLDHSLVDLIEFPDFISRVTESLYSPDVAEGLFA